MHRFSVAFCRTLVYFSYSFHIFILGCFRCDPYDPQGFKSWAMKGACPAIPQILGVYKTLIENGFKVFLITGRDELLLGPSTTMNLFMQGFVGHEQLMMR